MDACTIFIFSDILVITTPEVNRLVENIASIPLCGCKVILMNDNRYRLETVNDSYTFHCETKANLGVNLRILKSYIRKATKELRQIK